MKQQFIFVLLFLLSVSASEAQTIVRSGGRMNASEKEVETRELDQASVKVYYLFSQKRNIPGEKPFRNDTMSLYIGNEISYYFDESFRLKDSIASSMLNNFPVQAIKSISVLKNQDSYNDIIGEKSEVSYFDGNSEKIYKNRVKKEMTLINKGGNELFQCIDPVEFDWHISGDTTTILGYSCQKAETHFRGRNYEVWFAPEIPINEGPWKFHGLPGLILKVSDDKGLISFESIGLEELKDPYPITRSDNKPINCNLKKYAQMIRDKGTGMAYFFNGGDIVIASKKMDSSYEDLESQ